MTPKFAIVPASIICDDGLSTSAKALALTIGLFMDREKGCWPSQDTLANYLNLKRQRLSDLTKELETRGHLTVTRRHRSPSLYRFLDSPILRRPDRTLNQPSVPSSGHKDDSLRPIFRTPTDQTLNIPKMVCSVPAAPTDQHRQFQSLSQLLSKRSS